MNNLLYQILITSIGVPAIWLASRDSRNCKHIGSILGLFGQVFYVLLFISSHQYLMLVPVGFYTLIWLKILCSTFQQLEEIFIALVNEPVYRHQCYFRFKGKWCSSQVLWKKRKNSVDKIICLAHLAEARIFTCDFPGPEATTNICLDYSPSRRRGDKMKTVKIPRTSYRLQLVSEKELKEQAESKQISNKVLSQVLYENMQLIRIVRRCGYEWPPKSN